MYNYRTLITLVNWNLLSPKGKHDDKRNAYSSMAGKYGKTSHLENQDIDVGRILKWILEEWVGLYSTGSGQGRGLGIESLDLTVIGGLVAFVVCQNLYSAERANLFKSVI